MKDLDTSIFNLSTIKLPVHRGDLLVAQPFLSEIWFNRAVISVIDYDKSEGATGVVMNNCMKYSLAEVLDGVDQESDMPVFCGGPLSQDRLFFLHTLGPQIIPDAREYTPGLYIGGDFDSAIDYVNAGYPTEGYIRFFVGYSGWSPGQLDEEIVANTWAVHPVPVETSDLLIGSGDSYWHRIVRSMGSPYRTWQMLPQDIHAN